jgi:hypothetical protein
LDVRTAIKKSTGIFFLLPGCTPWLLILVFCIKQQSIRHEMKEKLEQAIPLHSVTIADKEVVWVKKGKEIRVNGKMFDIKTAKSGNGFTTFTGLYDEDETLLKKQLAESWQKKSSGENKTLLQLIVSLQNVFYETTGVEIMCRREISHYYLFDHTGLPVNFRLILTPPPRT